MARTLFKRCYIGVYLSFYLTSQLKEGRELTVALFGKTGNGKSATANQIVGEEHFIEGDGAGSVTFRTNYWKRQGDRGIRVIDTPGIMDTAEIEKSNLYAAGLATQRNKTLNEIAKVFEMAPPGLDAILLFIQYGVRFTQEDVEALEMLVKFLGEESKGYMILVLTHGDQAARNAKKKRISVERLVDEWLKSLPGRVREFIRQINSRVVLFDNTLEVDTENEAQVKQVQRLADAIDAMMTGRRKPFVNEMSKASKKELDRRVEEAMEASGLISEMKRLEIKGKEFEAKEREVEKERKMAKEREKAREREFEKEMERARQREKAKEIEFEKERERTRQREKAKEIEFEKQKEEAKEREKARKMELEKEMHDARQRGYEKERKEAMEREEAREMEARKREEARQMEYDKERKEARQKDEAREKKRDIEREEARQKEEARQIKHDEETKEARERAEAREKKRDKEREEEREEYRKKCEDMDEEVRRIRNTETEDQATTASQPGFSSDVIDAVKKVGTFVIKLFTGQYF